MRKSLLHAAGGSIVLVVCLAFSPSPAQAQNFFGGNSGGILNDPFSFYYAFYLPNQQMQAMRPKPTDTIDQAMAARQYYAQMDRTPLVDPVSPLNQSYDPLRPYSKQGGERMARPFVFAGDPSNSDGSGPSLYFNRTGKYHPKLRVGHGPNANVNAVAMGRANRFMGNRASSGGRGGGGGFGGMGGMGRGMGGMGMGGMGMGGMGMGGMGGGMGGMGMM